MKLSRQSPSCVVAKVVECYQKAHIITIHKAKIAEKNQALHAEYCNLTKLNLNRRAGNITIEQFKTNCTRPCLSGQAIVRRKMEETKRGNSAAVKQNLDEDTTFFQRA